MNQHHRKALKHHCRLAVETVHPRFRSTQSLRGVPYGLVLTVNSGYE